jgi:hypothetical protein
MTTSQENQFLFKEKISEGKGEIQAKKEILSLQEHQRAYRTLWAKYQSLEKENVKLLNLIAKTKKETFRENFKQISSKDRVYAGDLKHLRRIIHFMQIDKHYTLKELAEELRLATSNVRPLLDFLSEFKIIELNFPINCGVIRTK